MAVSTYAELKTAVANWLADSTLTSRIPEFIVLVEGRIRRDERIRFRGMEATETITINSQTEALPTRYLGMRSFYIQGSPNRRLEYLNPENFWIRLQGGTTGRPKFFTVEGNNLVFAPTPDTAYTGIFQHYASFAPFSSDTDTNTLLTDHAGIYLYGALVEAAGFIGDDPRIPLWAQMYDEAAESIEKMNRRDRYPGHGLMARSDVPVA